MFEPDDEVLVAAFDKAVSSYRQMFKRGRSAPEVPGNTSQDVSGRGGSARKARPAREEEREGEKKRRRQSVAVVRREARPLGDGILTVCRWSSEKMELLEQSGLPWKTLRRFPLSWPRLSRRLWLRERR